MDAAEAQYPVVASEVRTLLSLGAVREILQALTAEMVSISNIAVILETLADWGGFGPASGEIMVEHVRQALRRQICLQYADGSQTLRVLTVEAELDQKLSDPAMMSEAGSGQWDALLEALSPAVCGMEEKGLPPVILCSPPARSWLKELTRKKFPCLAVLSYMEIPPDIRVEPLGEIKL
jgi:flagellar biosynthesis protein FlhA